MATLAQAGSEGEREVGTHAEAPSAPHFRACAWRQCETRGRRRTWEAEGARSDWGVGHRPWSENPAHLSRGQVGRRCELGLWPRLCTHRRGQPHSSPAPHTAVPGVNSWPSLPPTRGFPSTALGLLSPPRTCAAFQNQAAGFPGPGKAQGTAGHSSLRTRVPKPEQHMPGGLRRPPCRASACVSG